MAGFFSLLFVFGIVGEHVCLDYSWVLRIIVLLERERERETEMDLLIIRLHTKSRQSDVFKLSRLRTWWELYHL